MWPQIVARLGPPISTQAYRIYNWLRGESFLPEDMRFTGAMYHFSPELLWQWIDGDVENRAWYAAMFVPKELHHDPNRTCFAREVLARYGDRDDVRRNLSANFETEGWSGPESAHCEAVKRDLEEFAWGETDPKVLRWINDHIRGLDWRIEQANIREEREY
jgi:hypothetical protein